MSHTTVQHTKYMREYRKASPEYRAKNYTLWKAWVARNLERRREIARLSAKRRYWAKRQPKQSAVPVTD